MTIAEVSHILSIPEGTVKTRLRRSKDLIKGNTERNRMGGAFK